MKDTITPSRRLQSVFSHVADGVKDQFTSGDYHRVHTNSNLRTIKIIDVIYGYEYTMIVMMTHVPEEYKP